ncbi:serine--tRNA ligase [Patescibacteria group bacterium]|nr:serine--tRNA ligase [Patescibacteria group bacterium]
MLDIKFIREHVDEVREGLRKKRSDVDLDLLLALDEKRRALIQKSEALKAEQNRADKEIAQEKDSDAKKITIEKMRVLKDEVRHSEFEARAVEEEFVNLMMRVPNLPDSDSPEGGEKDFRVLREVGNKPEFLFLAKDYVVLGENLDLIDTARAAKVSGSRFGYLKHEAPLLEFALIQFAFSFLTNQKNIAEVVKEKKLSISDKPFIPIIPPVLVRPEMMRSMGYTERGGEEIYFLEKDNLYLVGTAEQSVGPMHADEVFDEDALPHRHIAFSTCFRREAGSYGKDIKGILRVHQFDKAEMFVFSTPESSRDEHMLLLGLEEKLMQALKIPYRALQIAAGDLGDPASAKYDIEAWLPGQQNGKGEYRETHSASSTTDFQARRLNIKVRRKNGAQEFLHMLNGTAFAVGRMIIAILENYQQEDGSVRVPEVLQSYIGMKEIKR